jgi:hypothetical protein
MSSTPKTKTDAYKQIKEAGEDVSLRKKVAASIADAPATTSGLSDRFPEHTSNALRPRVDELLRMGCVERSGTRTNPSGHDAYVHHLTTTGERYLRDEVDPDPGPTLSELKTEVVDAARAVVHGDASPDALETVVNDHDAAKLSRDPEWTPPYDMTDTDRDDGTDTDTDENVDKGLTDEQREKIKNDPVLEISDFRDTDTEQ